MNPDTQKYIQLLEADRDAWRQLAVRATINIVGITMDTSSEKWIAPHIWSEMLSVRQEVYMLLNTTPPKQPVDHWVRDNDGA